MELLESLLLVKHGTTTLVSIGDPMWDTVRVNGGQLVQEAERVRAAGIHAMPRGNERNTVDFVLCVEAATVEAAVKLVLAHPLTLPRTKADVSITFADGSGILVKNAAVRSWGGGHEGSLARLSVAIIGGEQVTIPAT